MILTGGGDAWNDSGDGMVATMNRHEKWALRITSKTKGRTHESELPEASTGVACA